MLTITGGGVVSSDRGRIGARPGSMGEAVVAGAGSTWTNSGDLRVGDYGSGTLRITGGGAVSDDSCYIGGYSPGSTGDVTVAGAGSMWTNNDFLCIGREVGGVLSITFGGLVRVAAGLTIDYDKDGDGFVNIASGGMLALAGDAGDSLAGFMDLIYGTDAIRYWDPVAYDWADITGATAGEDYTLTYLTEGDLAGYSLLTVFPGPISGDANLDAKVSISDLSAVADNYGRHGGAAWEQGDYNGDGIVGIADLSAVADNYGRTAGGGATVPEPTILLLLAVGAIALGRRRGSIDD